MKMINTLKMKNNTIETEYSVPTLKSTNDNFDGVICISTFIEWSADSLNSAIQDLEFKNNVFIINKQLHSD